MKLFDLELSGNCYKIRLFLSVLKMDYQKIPVNMAAGDNTSDTFLAMNPNGLVPVLIDEETTLYDSAAILTYLAKKYAEPSWLPLEPIALSNVIKWLAFEQSEIRYGLARARVIKQNIASALASTGSLDESQSLGQQALEMMQAQLQKTNWLAATETPSICDLACYPYTAMCDQGGLSLEAYPAIRDWMKRIEQIDGYIPLPQINIGN